MHQTLTTNQAARILANDQHSTFSYDGAIALVEFLEEMEADSGSMELDPIAIRCEWTQYNSAEEALKDILPEEFDRLFNEKVIEEGILSEDGELSEEAQDLCIEEEAKESLEFDWLCIFFDDGVIVRNQ